MLKRFLLWSFFLAVFVAFIGAYSLVTGNGNEDKAVLIPRGVPLAKIGTLLQQEGIISQPTAFKILAKLTGGNRRMKAGEYAFKTEMGPLNALFVFYYSTPIEHVVTIPEGWNVRQIASILAAQHLVDPAKFTLLALSKKSAEKHRLKSPNLEGFLYPDTYSFSRVDGEDRILDIMVQHFFAKVSPSLIAEAKQKGMSLEELVTLASIIEKETGASSERELISSVFHNRLQKRMRLQSDPTTIYGIENFNGNLTRKDLTTPTPYNTYTISGLPPGAICSPGLAALVATVRPAKSGYLYFVANQNREHVFSETYAAHSRAVNQFQKRRASPRQADSTRELGAARRKK